MGGEKPGYNPIQDIIDNGNPPPVDLDNGWNNADTVNPNIFCPNPELGIMELCDEHENPGPTDEDIEDAYTQDGPMESILGIKDAYTQDGPMESILGIE